MARARNRFSADSTRGVGPASTSSRASSRLLGKSRRTWSRSCSTRDHGALLGAPALDQRHQVGDGLGVDRGERLVQQHEVGVLQQQPGEQHALELADRQRVDRPALEAAQPDRFDGMLRIVDVDLLGRAEARRSATSGRAARCRTPRSGRSGRLRPAAANRRCASRCTRCGPRCAAPSPSSAFSSVLLPAPLGPTIAVISPPGSRPIRDAPRDGGRSSR